MANITLNLCATLLSVQDNQPHILTIKTPKTAFPALPMGCFTPEVDYTLDYGVRRHLKQQTQATPRYIEQLYTFGDQKKHASTTQNAREITISYLGLLPPQHNINNSAIWHNVYTHLPWEDLRPPTPTQKMHHIHTNLQQWAKSAKTPFEQGQRRQRISLNFGLEGTPFNSEHVLERYQLLYEAGLVVEAQRDYHQAKKLGEIPPVENRFQNTPNINFWAKYTGQPMALNHRRVLAGALQRMRGKIKYRPLIFELLPEEFTLFDLQQVAEALAGEKLHKQNFRRLILHENLVEDTGKIYAKGRGRPAALFKFRPEVRYERTAIGIGLPKQ